MKLPMKLTAIFEKAKEGGYLAYIEEIPGANTQGETLQQAKENLRDAFLMLMKARRSLAKKQQAKKAVIRETIVIGS